MIFSFLKLACQDEDTEGEDDDQEAEYDSMLMEYAGELIASLNKIVPWQQFGPYLAGLMPFLFARTVCIIFAILFKGETFTMCAGISLLKNNASK